MMGRDYDLGLESLLALDGAKEILGVANHFRIEALFCGNAGWNLRNLIAHGLVDENEHNMDLLQFAWLTIIDFLLSYKKE